jgi:hypothetical protein
LDGRRHLTFVLYADANTVGTIAAIASIDWGAAIQIMAAAGIASNGSFSATNSQTLFVTPLFYLSLRSDLLTRVICSGVYGGIVLSHAVVCSLGTKVLARLQNVYIALNILWAPLPNSYLMYDALNADAIRLCLAVIIALPIATPSELMNSASYAFGNFTNWASPLSPRGHWMLTLGLQCMTGQTDLPLS